MVVGSLTLISLLLQDPFTLADVNLIQLIPQWRPELFVATQESLPVCCPFTGEHGGFR